MVLVDEIMIDELPSYVQSDLEESSIENETKLKDMLTLDEAIKGYLEWNGIFGYDDRVMDIIKSFKEE